MLANQLLVATIAMKNKAIKQDAMMRRKACSIAELPQRLYHNRENISGGPICRTELQIPP
jgi:hypothetical protein